MARQTTRRRLIPPETEVRINVTPADAEYQYRRCAPDMLIPGYGGRDMRQRGLWISTTVDAVFRRKSSDRPYLVDRKTSTSKSAKPAKPAQLQFH